jgi:hypothetical protein
VNFANYADFRNRVQIAIDGDDISTSDLSVAVLDTQIGIAEQRIYRDLRSSVQDAPLVLTTTGNLAPLPADFIELRGAPYVGTFAVATYVPWEEITNSINFNQDTSSNRVVRYSFQSDSMIFYPVQTDGTSITAQYYRRFPDISISLNPLFTRHPDVFYYGALAVLGDFVGETERAPKWEQMYLTIVQSVNETERRRYTRGGKLSTRVA